jgi:hypothetical protein
LFELRQSRKTTSVMKSSVRVSGMAVAILLASICASQPSAAMSPINPGMSGAGETVAGGLTIEVRGHGGGGGGWSGGHGGSWGGGQSVGGIGGGVNGAFVRSGAIGAGAPAVAGSPHFAGHGFSHRRHFGRVFVGGVYYDDDYPYDDSAYYNDYPPSYPGYPAFVAGGGCHRVMTVHGPRVVCHRRAARHHHHHAHRRHHHRRDHRA